MSIYNTGIRRIAMILGAIAMVQLAACSSAKKKVDDESGISSAAGADENSAFGDSDSDRAMGLQTVHFPYDSFILSEEGKTVLKQNAKILKSKSQLKIQIEGHCDQRGGIQYNIALGEKRANAAKRYLEDQGIAGHRMTIISFGKEKPLDPGISDEAYAKNRRANFVITAK